MKKFILIPALLVSLLSTTTIFSLQAQTYLLNRMRDKAADKMIDKAFSDKKDDKTNTSSGNATDSPNPSGTQNTKGNGLSTSTTDIAALIDDASNSFEAKKYTSARALVKQAMAGIEIEMGKNVLKGLPETVSNLDALKDEDQVTSSGAGYIGLTIQRKYEKKDLRLDFMIANNSFWISAVNMQYANTTTNTNTQQNYKQIMFQGNKGIIEFESSSGYKLSVPFGQQSILIIQAVNFDNETQVMAAAEKFNLEEIKKKLGEK